MVNGIDIFHLDKPDWNSLKKAGVEFAYIKLTQGANITDSKGVGNVAAAREAGILVGVYHYLTPEGNAYAQYTNFVKQVQLCGGFDGMLPPALDVEGDRNNNISPMTKDGYVASAQAWLTDLEKDTGIRAVVYTYRSFAEEVIHGKLSTYPLWASSIHEPGNPSPFVGWGNNWLYHQFTTTGAGNGIPIF